MTIFFRSIWQLAQLAHVETRTRAVRRWTK
jgi:hypothetical protein